MKSCRIHVMGASGSGVTTLGRALADALAIPHHDTDDYFWQPTTPPFQNARDAAERLRLMQEMFLPRPGWILAGSLSGWGDILVPRFDLVVFLTTPQAVRLRRLREREARRYGADAVAPGGWRHEEQEKFLRWAASYDSDDSASRNLAGDQAWLAALACPVLRLNGDRP